MKVIARCSSDTFQRKIVPILKIVTVYYKNLVLWGYFKYNITFNQKKKIQMKRSNRDTGVPHPHANPKQVVNITLTPLDLQIYRSARSQARGWGGLRGLQTIGITVSTCWPSAPAAEYKAEQMSELPEPV